MSKRSVPPVQDAVLEALPRGQFRTLLADPPWPYRDRMSHASYGAVKHYQLLSLDQIAAIPVAEVMDDNAHLYLWTTNAFIEQAHVVARAWGFAPKTIITWVKATPGKQGKVLERIQYGLGWYFRNCTEHVLVCVRGKGRTTDRHLGTILVAPRTRHSQKPELLYEWIEKTSPEPRLEMFARATREGWSSWGNEVAGEDEDDDSDTGEAPRRRFSSADEGEQRSWCAADGIEEVEAAYEGRPFLRDRIGPGGLTLPLEDGFE